MMEELVKLMKKQMKELLRCQKEYNISDKMVLELAERGIFSIYYVWEKDRFEDWASWYAMYWSWRPFNMTEEKFEKTTEADWRSWVLDDARFYLGSDNRIYEHSWQTDWNASESDGMAAAM